MIVGANTYKNTYLVPFPVPAASHVLSILKAKLEVGCIILSCRGEETVAQRSQVTQHVMQLEGGEWGLPDPKLSLCTFLTALIRNKLG